MLVYVITTAVSMFFATYAGRTKDIKNLKSTYICLAIASWLPFAIIGSIRYHVGTDWPIYNSFFYSINQGGERFSEIGFNLLNQFLYLFSKDSQIIFAVTTILTTYFVFRAIYSQSVCIPMSILIFVISADYFSSLNQLRQALAMAIFLYALQYVWKRDWKRYFLWIFIALLFHNSAIIYFPVYFLRGKKVNLKAHFILFGGSIALLPVLKKVIIFVISKTPYGWYLESAYANNNFYLIGFLFSLIFLVFYEYYAFLGEEKNDEQYNFMVNMYYLSTYTILFSAVIPQVSRISGCLSYIGYLAIPKMIFREKIRHRRIVLYMLLVFLYLVKVLYDVYKNHWYDVLPYQTIFS